MSFLREERIEKPIRITSAINIDLADKEFDIGNIQKRNDKYVG